MSDKHLAEVWRREAEHHDRQANEADPRSLPPLELDVWRAAVVEAAGEVHGRAVLELGCGSGDLTLRLLARGARLTAIDISPGMVELVRTRIAYHPEGREAQLLVAPAEATGLESGSFDLVVGTYVIHHLDVERAAAEAARLLRPGGRCLFVENSGFNPFLNLARRHLTGRFGVNRCGTPDEHPLRAADYAIFARHFRRVTTHYVELMCFRLIARNVFRYRVGAVNWLTHRIDTLAYRVPFFRRFSYHVLVELER
jgi:ubiquinone/menaquinone biosynthesis C-methylase UbiE